MEGPISLDIRSLRSAYRDRTASPPDVIEQVLAAIGRADDPAIWIHRVADAELRTAAAALAGRDPASLPLYGIPFAVKDNIDIAGIPTTAACPAFSFVPKRTAPAIQRLLDAGAILIGKTNLDQFATGLVGVRTPYGVCRNPLDPACVPGGSSAGSAVCVAAGLASFALGTDTAGSGRVPAGFNNIVGIKPTKGLVSTRGIVPACRTLDCVSVFALTCEDGADVLEVIAGYDGADPFSRRQPADAAGRQDVTASGLRFGVPRADQLAFFGNDEYANLFAAAVERVQALGAAVVEFDFSPFAETARLLYEGPWVAERYAALRRFLETNAEDLQPVTRTIVENGASIGAADAFAGIYRLAELQREAESVWLGIDVMLLPTAGTIYTVAEVEASPIRLNANLGYYTNFVNLLDQSALAVPSGMTESGRPFGITLVGPAFADSRLAGIGAELHRATGLPLGATGARLAAPASTDEIRTVRRDELLIAVNGAHMSGLPLNGHLVGLGARFVRADRTAAAYRMFSIENLTPIRPGLVRSDDGMSIALELWSIPSDRVGQLLSSIPGPLGLGTVELASGQAVKGFVCEAYAAREARDISEFGGWRAFLASGPHGGGASAAGGN
ncbi:MAG: allophanate hydrolase [Rhodospirillaceae bacterium]